MTMIAAAGRERPPARLRQRVRGEPLAALPGSTAGPVRPPRDRPGSAAARPAPRTLASSVTGAPAERRSRRRSWRRSPAARGSVAHGVATATAGARAAPCSGGHGDVAAAHVRGRRRSARRARRCAARARPRRRLVARPARLVRSPAAPSRRRGRRGRPPAPGRGGAAPGAAAQARRLVAPDSGSAVASTPGSTASATSSTASSTMISVPGVVLVSRPRRRGSGVRPGAAGRESEPWRQCIARVPGLLPAPRVRSAAKRNGRGRVAIGTVGVVGLGTMGAGIAQVCLEAGPRRRRVRRRAAVRRRRHRADRGGAREARREGADGRRGRPRPRAGA